MSDIDNYLTPQLVLQSDLVREVFSSLEREYMESWSNSTDIDAREDLFYRLQALRAFRTDLEGRVFTQKMRSL